ncbi:MAG TPA: alpha/beta fold hydrolase [Dongiaceae bacterium]
MADAVLSFPRFRSRLPWWGRDLQTLRNYIVSIESSLAPYPAERVEFPMTDGDRLLASLHRPAEDLGRALVVLIHGLTGSEDSAYIRASALHFLDQGYRVLRLNLRGAGPSKGVCRSRYHAGRSDDLRQVLGQMDGRLAGKGLLLVGYSLGGNLLLKYLGEAGRRAIVRGAVSISAPIDLDAARRSIMRPRNRLYHRHIVSGLKLESESLELTAAQRRILAEVETVFDFDDRILAPLMGFADALDYYRRSMALPLLPEIRVPTLVIHARNDPWIPFRSYRDFDWASNPRLIPLLPTTGGHVGFHGRGSRVPWHDRSMALFFGRLG